MGEAEATARRGTYLARVTANEALCDEHLRLRLALPAFPPTQPGQFVQVQCRRPEAAPAPRAIEWSAGRPPKLTQPDLVRAEALLRRPFSLAGRVDGPEGGVELRIIYRVVGSGTDWLRGVTAGEPVSVLGPLGNAFAIREGKSEAALVGGGVGIPPLLYLAEALAARGRRATAFCGVRSANLLPLRLAGGAAASAGAEPSPCVEDFAVHGAETVLATDDGSLGWRGFVNEAFERWLDGQAAPGGRLVVYACGPEPMMRAVGEACIRRDVECQLALERHMACGMGTCQSCVFKMRAEGEGGWVYKLVCTDGPVFDARAIVWE
jgi:dihydroorotate dehydrogenase electron transfer subunit